MITEMQLVPVTADSHPFASAQFHCRLSEIGYTEEEYFLSGTANVYEEGENNRPEIIFRDAPYTTRVLIRRPADKSRFSGNVVVEVLNATAVRAAPILPPCPSITRIFISHSSKFFARYFCARQGFSTTPETGSSPYISAVQSIATPPTVTGSPAA